MNWSTLIQNCNHVYEKFSVRHSAMRCLLLLALMRSRLVITGSPLSKGNHRTHVVYNHGINCTRYRGALFSRVFQMSVWKKQNIAIVVKLEYTTWWLMDAKNQQNDSTFWSRHHTVSVGLSTRLSTSWQGLWYRRTGSAPPGWSSRAADNYPLIQHIDSIVPRHQLHFLHIQCGRNDAS